MADARMLHTYGLTAKMIAEALQDNPSPEFCRSLAILFDPGRKKPLYSLKLKLARPGQPKGDDSELGRAMISATEGVKRGDLKGVKIDVAERFGVTVRSAEKAMQRERDLAEIWEWLQRRERGE